METIRISEPWSITCLPQSSPRDRTPLFFEIGGGVRGGEGQVRQSGKMKGYRIGASKYIPL